MNKRLKLREREVRYQRQLNPKAAMYENPRKDIVDFAKWVINNPESNAVRNKTKTTQRTSGGIDLVIPANRVQHSYSAHQTTSKDWKNVLDNIDNNIETWSISDKADYHGKNSVLLKVNTPAGKYGVSVALSGDNTNTITTIFKSTDKGIDNWLKQNGTAYLPVRGSLAAASPAQGRNGVIGQHRLTNIITQARERSGTNAIQRKETGTKKNNAEIVEADRYGHGGHDDTIRQRQKYTERSGENVQPEKREKLTDTRYQRTNDAAGREKPNFTFMENLIHDMGFERGADTYRTLYSDVDPEYKLVPPDWTERVTISRPTWLENQRIVFFDDIPVGLIKKEYSHANAGEIDGIIQHIRQRSADENAQAVIDEHALDTQAPRYQRVEKPLAPNGKPSNLTPEQYRQVRTPEFKKWFGDWENDPDNASKVVDENGEPLVVWHGSQSKFSEFKML
jgi:hypothetical protein